MTDDTPRIALESHDAVRVLRLTRPAKYNAVDMAMHQQLADALSTLETDEGARALVVTAEGLAFSSGQDLREIRDAPDDLAIDDHVRATFNRHVVRLRELPMPVIAAVNGIAAGAGASLALAADMRLVADTGGFMQAFVRIGLIPDTGSTWLLPQLIGLGRALELSLSGRLVGAEEAVSLGLANEMVPADALMDRALALATELAALPTRAIALTKQLVYAAADGASFAESLELEAQLQKEAFTTDDHREGITAFFEKREAVFTGR